MIANIIGTLFIVLGSFLSILLIVRSYKDSVKKNKPACFGCMGCTGCKKSSSCHNIF